LRSTFSILVIIFVQFTLLGQSSLNVNFLDNWRTDTLLSNSSEARYSDCWGYEKDGIEYAFIGSTEGIHFFKITDNKFEAIDFIAGRYSSTSVIHRDLKTYKNFLYSVCDEGESSLQIIDLSYLPDSAVLVAENDTTFAQVHNLFIDPQNELLYACLITPKSNGTLLSQKSMEVFSISDPVSPTLVYSGPNDIPEVHDAYVRNNISYLNCGFDGLRIYDFSTPSSPIFIQNIAIYQDQGYNHQGWLSPDGKTYVFGDETNGKKLKRCTVDENNILTIKQRFGTNTQNGSVPHNIILTDNFAFVAYYNEGFRIYDLRNSSVKEIAHYDTYPQQHSYKLNGAWGVYSELPSGRILISDRQNGLFLLDFNRSLFSTSSNGDISISPNPVSNGEFINIRLNGRRITSFNAKIIDTKGKEIIFKSFYNSNAGSIPIYFSKGIYFIQIEYIDYLGDTIRESKRLIVH